MVQFIILLFVIFNATACCLNAEEKFNQGVSVSKGRLEGRVALVTGASQGMGKEIVRVLIREGAYVVATDIQDDLGHLVAQEMGDSCMYMHLDVRIEKDWKKAMQTVMETYSKLDILVNNAGIQGYVDPENGALEMWKEIHSVDSEGVFLGCKYAIQTMKSTTKQGSIINISSIAWLIGMPSGSAYSASKAAVTNLTKSVAVYCGQQGYPIRCNWISPGFIPTPMLMSIKRNDEQEAIFQEYIRSIPMGKMGTTEDIANGVLFLASDESKYITATELKIDGGVTAWTGMPWTRKN